MTGLYIFGSLILIGTVVLIVFIVRSRMADTALSRQRAENIEKDRIEAIAKAEARGQK